MHYNSARMDHMVKKTCKQCGVTFTPPSTRKGNNMKYCSETCRAKAYNEQRKKARQKYNKKNPRTKYVLKLCEYCGKPFISHNNIKYCSITCRQNSRREQNNNHVKHYKATHPKTEKQKYFDNLGTSNLRAHRKQNFNEERLLVLKEKWRLHI